MLHLFVDHGKWYWIITGPFSSRNIYHFFCLKSLKKLYLLLQIWSQISIHLLRETPKNSRIVLSKIIGHPGVGSNFQWIKVWTVSKEVNKYFYLMYAKVKVWTLWGGRFLGKVDISYRNWIVTISRRKNRVTFMIVYFF